MLQILARHSMHATHPAASPPASSAFVVSPSASSLPAAAAPQPAQQQHKIQLRTITPPRIPQTTGSAVCGCLLPTPGTAGPATAGNGASGTLSPPILRVALDAPPVAPAEAWLALSEACCVASCPCTTARKSRKKAQRTTMLDILLIADCRSPNPT